MCACCRHRCRYGQPDAPWSCSIDYAIDGWVIPTQPYELFGTDGTIDFDVMIGTTTGMCTPDMSLHVANMCTMKPCLLN
eukprot:COSAG01_NODE_3011_length_6725_cov_71.575158_5_plen_79_part_00